MSGSQTNCNCLRLDHARPLGSLLSLDLLMKRAQELDECIETYYSLPREVWMLILSGVPFPTLIRFSTISAQWREMAYLSVKSFEGKESQLCLLADASLVRFASLQELSVPRVHTLSDAGLSLLVNLTYLDLSNCEKSSPPLGHKKNVNISPVITDLAVSGLVQLRTLVLRSNGSITDRGISDLTQLTHLDLAGNRLITDHSLRRLTNLEVLNLPYSGSGVTKEGVKDLVSLTYLNITANHFMFDEAIQNLTNLRSLSVSCTEISNAGVTALTNLTFLRLQHTHFVTDDGLIGFGLAHLTALDLSYQYPNGRQGFKISDDGLLSLLDLSALDLSYNLGISDRAIVRMDSLIALALTANDCITDDGVSRLTNLTNLKIARNKILTNRSIMGLTKLTSLDLSQQNAITDDALTNLTNLTLLELVRNEKISNYGIKGLTRLTYLDISYSSSISNHGIKGLTGLRFLDICCNAAITYGGAIRHLTNLTALRSDSTLHDSRFPSGDFLEKHLAAMSTRPFSNSFNFLQTKKTY